ncbi:4-hydroxythreonine-4-phosphate dehydrogenase PdxA (plasmid) [Deinococcus metallilatus]|uniref:4-hydroxythreonine-4-phosphate dehydrogenase n=1 Tax=Deinococcus metallilatus TaxID=1211322 RepID=A0AAJ5K6T4_9DEIO|nr:4-hydroxythreonine-4-phosphate dehydrogenase PdxA [Deinococcus metallilatus]MBB5293472.1 4-hydroxythreonine-4-phosphate dehydrogenase [Deinococcus metallilatus]QBY06556.1 4-hydroxythreonine-4-phosphate dehydrogenase PdxA [Deinococcus metallilatus]RXJ17899.1 4-hydroxythreonine-4-phosphate dehydrogenase PdxA [Deinococcus metallilatus]TLK32171.1 4-hydroxythreonine-4-phosphate dehydrogenase PdxA [Deinococcus metallilatus]GMA15308.1 4-hydroxythreonine-4-phosphate dehydrogenase [Deinococcus metal
MPQPIIGITMGDPAGIGPEIIAKAFADPRTAGCRAVVIGDVTIMRRAVTLLNLPLEVRPVDVPADATFAPGVVNVVPVTDLPEDLPFGQLSAKAGAAAFAYVRRSIELALSGQIQAVATAPLNKEALHLAGFLYPGHTEIFADLTGTRNYAMMLVAPDLRVIHVSTHVSLAEAIQRATRERELTVIRLADEALQRLGVPRRRIAVAGLNPHAGENGLFGREEIEQIIPAIQEAQREGIDVSGPWPGDTVFLRARRGDFDMVVVQYHDQGHIPVKLLGFDTGVNVTVGLPFFRTSVDHGTAFDIAGTGQADQASMQAAIELAFKLL